MPPPERIEGSWGIEPVPERLRVLELLDTSPLFAVLLADWLAAGRHYSAEDVFGAPAWRPV